MGFIITLGMKRIFFVFSLILISVCTYADFQTRIAVYVTGVISDNYKILLSNNLVEAFAESDQYIAVNRSEVLNSMLNKARNIQENGHVDLTQIVSATKEYGESQLCIVEVIEIDGMYVFQASLLDALKNTVIKTASAESAKSELGYTKCLEISKKLSSRLIQNNNSGSFNTFGYDTRVSDVDLARRKVEENRKYDISYAEFMEQSKYYSMNCAAARHYLKIKDNLDLTGIGVTVGVGGAGALAFGIGYWEGVGQYAKTESEEKTATIAMVCGITSFFIPGIIILSIAPAYKRKAWKAYRKPYDDAIKDLGKARRYQRSASMQLFPTSGYDWAGIGMRVTFN